MPESHRDRGFARRRFLGAWRNFRFENIRGDIVTCFPFPNIEGIFWRPCDLLARDHIAAGIGSGSLCDPDLPIDLFGPEGKVIAFDAADHAASKVLHVGDRRRRTRMPLGYRPVSSSQRTGEAGFGGGGRDQLDNHPIADEGPGTPVLTDEGEEAVLDFVPLAVPGGRWLTTMSRPSSLASFCSSRFHSRTREPLLPPPSAVISNRVALG